MRSAIKVAKKEQKESEAGKDYVMGNIYRSGDAFMDGFYSVRNGVDMDVVDCEWTVEQKKVLKKIGEHGYETVLLTGALGAGKTNMLVAHAVLEFLRRPTETVVVFCLYCEQMFDENGVRFDCDMSKGKNKPIRVYFGHIRLVYCSFAYSN